MSQAQAASINTGCSAAQGHTARSDPRKQSDSATGGARSESGRNTLFLQATRCPHGWDARSMVLHGASRTAKRYDPDQGVALPGVLAKPPPLQDSRYAPFPWIPPNVGVRIPQQAMRTIQSAQCHQASWRTMSQCSGHPESSSESDRSKITVQR